MTGGVGSAACLHMQRGSVLPQPCHAKDYRFLDRSRKERHEVGCLEPPFGRSGDIVRELSLHLIVRPRTSHIIMRISLDLVGVADHQAAFPAFLFQFSHN